MIVKVLKGPDKFRAIRLIMNGYLTPDIILFTGEHFYEEALPQLITITKI